MDLLGRYAVKAWLGIDEGNIPLGFELLEEFYTFRSGLESNPKLGFKSMRAVEKFSTVWYESHWDGICQILSKSYWTRLW
jgi:hypothetical protein